MLTKKIFFILLFSLTTNIYSQSNEVKELQSEIDTWKKYPFNQYVYDMDSNQIIVQNKNTGIISGVYSKWSSYSNSRYYEYIITPYDRNGNYSSTETKGITITSSYSKESHEKYIENRIEEIFQKIDSQLEIEKKQNEVQAAINEKNRKSKEYVDDQIKIINYKKDSILEEIDVIKSNLKMLIDFSSEIEENLEGVINFNIHEGDTLINVTSSKKVRHVKYSYGINNKIFGYSLRRDRTSYFLRDEIERYKSFFSPFLNITKFQYEFDLFSGFVNQLKKRIESNSKSFSQVEDEFKRKGNNYLDDSGYIINEYLLKSYREEIYKAKKNGYEYVYSPIKWKSPDLIKFLNDLEEKQNRFFNNQKYIEKENGYTELLFQDAKKITFLTQSSKIVSEFLLWYQDKLYEKISKRYDGLKRKYRKNKVEKYIECVSDIKITSIIKYLEDVGYGNNGGSGYMTKQFAPSIIFEIIDKDLVPLKYNNETDEFIGELNYDLLEKCLEKL
jgi:hypothetical protein